MSLCVHPRPLHPSSASGNAADGNGSYFGAGAGHYYPVRGWWFPNVSVYQVLEEGFNMKRSLMRCEKVRALLRAWHQVL